MPTHPHPCPTDTQKFQIQLMWVAPFSVLGEFWSEPRLSITVFSYVSVCFFLKADISIPPSKTKQIFLSFTWLNPAFSDCRYCFSKSNPAQHTTKLIFALFTKQSNKYWSRGAQERICCIMISSDFSDGSSGLCGRVQGLWTIWTSHSPRS